MAGTTPIYGFPYPQSTDLVANYPALGQDLATDVENVIAGLASQTNTAVKTDTYSQTSSTFTDITGLSVAITPSSSSKKVMVIVQIGAADASTADFINFRVLRGSTPIAVATSSGSRVAAGANFTPAASNRPASVILSILDSPATTSSTTYKVQVQSPASTLYINRTASDSDSASFPRTASTITVLEF